MANVAQTLAERGPRHGPSYLVQSSVAVAIKEALARGVNWASLAADQREALEMQAVKMARIVSGDPNFPDHWHDIGGYAKLVEDRLTAVVPPKRRRRRR